MMMETDLGVMLLQTNLTSRMAGSPPKLERHVDKWSPGASRKNRRGLEMIHFCGLTHPPTPLPAGGTSLWQLQDPRKKKVKHNVVYRRPLPRALSEFCGSVGPEDVLRELHSAARACIMTESSL